VAGGECGDLSTALRFGRDDEVVECAAVEMTGGGVRFGRDDELVEWVLGGVADWLVEVELGRSSFRWMVWPEGSRVLAWKRVLLPGEVSGKARALQVVESREPCLKVPERKTSREGARLQPGEVSAVPSWDGRCRTPVRGARWSCHRRYGC
jgi:hypothetical protein